VIPQPTPAERSERIRVELGISPQKWAVMNRQQRRAAARRYRIRRHP
jgi:hypothetical protein